MAYLTQMHDPIAAWLGSVGGTGPGVRGPRAGLAILLASLVGLERRKSVIPPGCGRLCW